MGSTSKRSASKQKRSPAKDRRSRSRTQNADASLHSSSTTSSPRKIETPKTARYSHRLPTDQQRRGNGRVAGRSLIMWNRPRMAEKLLLHIHYECNRHKIALPWDAIAHRLHPGSSGQAVCQHINRLRRELVAEGHLVPPPLPPKTSSYVDPEIRGYMRRDPDGSDLETTRPVMFGETIEDLKFSLPDAMNLPDEEVTESQETDCSSSPESIHRELASSPTPVRKAARGATESSPLPEVISTRYRFVAEQTPVPSTFSHPNDDVELEAKQSQHSAHSSETSSGFYMDNISPSHSFASSTMAPELGPTPQLIPNEQEFRTAVVRPWASQYPFYACTAPALPSTPVGFEQTEYFAPAMPPVAAAHYAFYLMEPSVLKLDTQDCAAPDPMPAQQEPVPHIGGPIEELFPGLNEEDGKGANDTR